MIIIYNIWKKQKKKVEEIERKKLREDSHDDSTFDEAIKKILKLKDIEKGNEDIDFGIAWVYERDKKRKLRNNWKNKLYNFLIYLNRKTKSIKNNLLFFWINWVFYLNFFYGLLIF